MMQPPSEPRDCPRADERTPRMKWLMWSLVASTLLITVQAWNTAPGTGQGLAPGAVTNSAGSGLNPTAHPAVPATLDAMWYARGVDAAPEPALVDLARGVAVLDAGGDAAAALPLVSAPSLGKSDVADYSRYYTGIALQRLSRLEEADAAFAAVAAGKTDGQIREAAWYRRAELREARMDFSGAAAMYEELLERKVASPQVALVKLGAASSAAGDRARAIEAHRRVLRDFTLSSEAAEAEELLERLGGFTLDTPAAVSEELGRAEALFKARKWDQAKSAYDRVGDRVDGEDRQRVTLRLAQIQTAQGQHRAAREVFRRFLNHETLAAEAEYGVLAATRGLGERDDVKQLTADFVARHPNSPLAEEALSELARRYVLDDEDGKAAEVYTTLVERFPSGVHAERAVWKAGWWAYREKNFAETVRLFEHGAATFPRSDFRPPWLYWSARAYDQMANSTSATERYRLTAIDYRNTYYGRLAWRQLEQRNEATVAPGMRRAIVTPPPLPGNVERISRLIEIGLYRPALNELYYAQRVWGDSAPLQATIALVHNKMGNLRLGINAMKRAYPQFMTAGGETLPRQILEVIFPLDYWPLLKGNAQAQGLDPYIVAALAAQESTFDAAIRSPANAVGLMQIMPATGRQLARETGMASFSERSLENAEINARLGTKYFADLVRRFGGGHHYALASYNAGAHRVQRWNNEAPGLPQDEWIDNIPFAETQNYVKRILGSADDYRRLYGEGQLPSTVTRPIARPQVAQASVKKAPVKKRTVSKRTANKRTISKRTPGKKKPVVRKSTTKRPPARKAPTRRR